MHEDSPNGGVERWLGGGEGTMLVKKQRKGGSFSLLSVFIAGRERERGDRGPARRQQCTGDTMARTGFPYPRSLTGGPRSAFEPVARLKKVFGPHYS
jgi:hypothetical protein